MDAIQQMIRYLDKKTRKEGKNKASVYLYAHNGKGFDSYMVKNDQGLIDAQARGEIKYKKLIKNTSGILNFQVSAKNCKLNFQCTLAHIPGSLKSLCEYFDVPESIKKDSLDILNITKQNFMQFKDKIVYYLQNDVLSLANIWMKHVQSVIRITNPCKCSNFCVCLDDVDLMQGMKCLDI